MNFEQAQRAYVLSENILTPDGDAVVIEQLTTWRVTTDGMQALGALVSGQDYLMCFPLADLTVAEDVSSPIVAKNANAPVFPGSEFDDFNDDAGMWTTECHCGHDERATAHHNGR